MRVLLASANVGWSAINFPKLEIRVIAVAVVVMIGNSGGVVSSYLYPTSDGPQFRKSRFVHNIVLVFTFSIGFGNTFNLCCAVMGAISSGFTSYYLYKQNQKLDQLYGPVDKDSKNKEVTLRTCNPCSLTNFIYLGAIPLLLLNKGRAPSLLLKIINYCMIYCIQQNLIIM